MIYSFNIFTVDTFKYVFTENSKSKKLEPRVFDVLVYLIENTDRVISKDELVEKFWDGRVITDSALNTCIRSIRKALGDSHENQKFIRTFPKRGFQFVAKVEVSGEDNDANSIENIEHVKESKSHRLKLFIGLMTVLVVLLGYRLINWNDANNKKEISSKPVIAVLDFKTTLLDESQRYFTEGLTEELVASLSLYRELFVIARNSSALYSDSEKSFGEIGTELGAQYIVTGNTRYKGPKIKVSARLVDTKSGQHIWSDDFDSNKRELFQLQRDLAYLIAGQVVPELVRSNVENNNKNVPEVMDAWAVYHKARIKQATYTEKAQDEAIRLSELTLIKDPNLAAAYGVIARAKGAQFFYQWSDTPNLTLEQAISSAKTAISLDKNDPGAYAALGYIYRYTGDEARAIANLERATRSLSMIVRHKRLEFSV